MISTEHSLDHSHWLKYSCWVSWDKSKLSLDANLLNAAGICNWEGPDSEHAADRQNSSAMANLTLPAKLQSSTPENLPLGISQSSVLNFIYLLTFNIFLFYLDGVNNSGWPRAHRYSFACLCLSSAGIKDVYYYAQLLLFLVMCIHVCLCKCLYICMQCL